MELSAVESLIEVLSGEKEVYARLLTVAEEERSLIVRGYVDKLSALLDEETALAAKARALEKKRIAAAEALAGGFGLKAERISLGELIGRIDEPGPRARLIGLRAEFAAIAGELAKVNGTNRALLKQKSDYIGAMLESAIKSEPFGSFYDRRGSVGVYSAGAGLFDRQA